MYRLARIRQPGAPVGRLTTESLVREGPPMRKSLAAIVLAAAVTLSACGQSAARHPAASPTPSAAAADPCSAQVHWRDSGGLASLSKIESGLTAMADDEDSADIAALQPDGVKLYAAAVSAAASLPPIDGAKYLKALRLAEKATVDAQAGSYQASTTAITETADIFSVMTSDLRAQCG